MNEFNEHTPSPEQPDHDALAIPSVGDLLTPDQVAEALGVSTKTLANYRARGTGPGHVRIGGRVFYTRTAYAAYWADLMGGAA